MVARSLQFIGNLALVLFVAPVLVVVLLTLALIEWPTHWK